MPGDGRGDPAARSTPTPRRGGSAAELARGARRRPAVVVADSFGRPWRLGQAEVAIGCAGWSPLDDWRGRADATGRELAATAIAVADQLAAAADLAATRTRASPRSLVRGAERWWTDDDGPGAAALQRPAERGPVPLAAEPLRLELVVP